MPAAAPTARPRNPVARNLTMSGVPRSEWTKLRSVRSTWWLLSVTVILTVGVAVFLLRRTGYAASRSRRPGRRSAGAANPPHAHRGIG
jgi:hypothetical protein